MFDIGFLELMLVAVVALLVIGPQRLPEAIRTIGLWVGRTKRALNRAYQEMDRELGLEDVRRQLHNEEVMQSLEQHKKRLEADIKGTGPLRLPETDLATTALSGQADNPVPPTSTDASQNQELTPKNPPTVREGATADPSPKADHHE